ncbi:hypothetical protein GGH94_006006 [Coemansia aciculifera]|uniref:Uncharacterized protein n=1 Tax=Coemansia aciculifera TaxID=417176 RepID=A0A9W8M2J7_9FUNG|nr:hypothetical protein GGH94_006006 [Coemansia aciculifera]
MQSISLIQFLPSRLVQTIVDYIVGSDRILFGGVINTSPEQRMLQMPLLWVCSNFRTDVYARFCRNYGLQVTGHTNAVRGMRSSWPVCLKQLDHPTQHLASELTIFTDIWSICSGRALNILSCAPYNGCAFPMVHKLKFYFNPPPPLKLQGDHTPDPQEIQANVSAFVQRIKVLAPMLSEIGVSVNLYSFDSSRTNDWWFDNLATELFQLANRIEYESPSMATRMTLLPDQVRNLTHIHYSAIVNGHNEQILQLARQNSSTLQSLIITLQGIADVSSLIQSTDGSYISYPCLYKLKAKQWMNPGISQRPVFVGALPFPALRYLGIGYDYPFGDDTIFRGNADTLEYLETMLSHATAAMLYKHNVFTPSSHPKLKCVKLTQMSDLVPNQFTSAAECMQFMLSIAPGASVREISSRSTGPELQSALSLLGDYTSIQVLTLPGSRLSLWDVIDLIRSLPLLSDLLTLPPCLEPLPAGIDAENILSCMLTRYIPMSNRFRCWQLGPHSSIASLETVECVLLLALICPSFGQATPPIGDRIKFMAAMADMVVMDKFQPHYPRLQRLLLNNWLKYR